jgi:hypothetical protein
MLEVKMSDSDVSKAYEKVLDVLSSGELTDDETKDIYVAVREALFQEYEWMGEKPYTIVVGGKEFSMRYKGKEQLALLGRLSSFLERDLADVFGAFEGREGRTSSIQNIKAFASLIDPSVAVSLGVVMLGESDEFVVDNFDLEWIIGGAEMIYHANPSVKRLVSAFFGRTG